MPQSAMLTMPKDLAEVITLHREMFDGFTMSSATTETVVEGAPADASADSPAGSFATPTDFVDDETGEKYGFPAKTPLSAMTEAQRAEYWRHKARKHESENKRLLQDADHKPAAQKREGDTEQSQPVDREAIQRDAEAAARAKYAPMAVRSEFKAALGDRRNADQIDAIIGAVDLTKFLTRSGEVDADKVIQYADAIAPKGVLGTSGPDMGQGNRGAGHVSKADAGRAEAERRFGKK